jgi:hypothetical protein
MSNLHNRISGVTSPRISVIGRNKSNLAAKLAEVYELREQVRKAERSARRKLLLGPHRRKAALKMH